MPYPKGDLPRFVRQCWEDHKKASLKNREAEVQRLNFYVGGDLQWKPEELDKRRQQNRPWITINKCQPAVNQIEGDIRINPPGPQCHPVGGGADGDTADIIEGLIRETEYRSHALTAYATAGKYVGATGCAYLELATEYTSERSDDQRLVVTSIEDPHTVFMDPTSRMANRQDAGWAGKLKMYGKAAYINQFGKARRVLQGRGVQSAMGWIQSAMGVTGNLAQIDEWTGSGNGPFFVAEFYMVDFTPTKLYKCSDRINRFEDEPVPPKVKRLELLRIVPRRKITKYLVDALETLDETEWLGDLIPIFPVLGPEVYIDGILHRLSLISGAIDSQRALNYAATTAIEVAGLMPKSPFIGAKGSFEDDKWLTANSEIFSYLEYTPVLITTETGQQVGAPPPQRNQWEASIQWLVMLIQTFSDSIKSVTGIYDPSLGKNAGDQSGKAIEQLRSESNVGNYSYSDNLHRSIALMYNQMVKIFQQIYDAEMVKTIVKANSQHELTQINRYFPDGIDPETGKKGKANNITIGEYSVRVVVGPDFDTRQKESVPMLIDFFKSAPQALTVPGVMGGMLRLMGDGNPTIEQMADLLTPGSDDEATPQQMQNQLMQAKAQNQQLTQAVQQLKGAIDAQLPKLEADKYKAQLDAAVKLRIAEITASKDLDKAGGDRDASLLEAKLGMAHEGATQAVQHEHEHSIADKQAAAAAQAQASDQAHATQSQESDQQAAAEQQEAAAGAGE